MAGALSFPAAAGAQTAASLGVGASYIEYDGFLPTGAGTFTPALRIDTRDISFGAQGSWTVFESGNQILQANAGAAWLAPAQHRLRVELSASGGAFKYADEPGAGHLLARSRLHLASERLGGWLTAGAGVSFDSTASTPVEIGLGGWTMRDRLALVGTATAAWVGDARHLELAAAARWTRSHLQMEARLGARPWASSADSISAATTGLWGELSALITLTSQVSLALSGGSYPSDPVRRVLGADYVTAGLRIGLSGREYSPPLAIPDALAALRQRSTHSNAATVRLDVREAGTQHVLRVHAAGARSVELMADFTDWAAVALMRTADGVWEIPLLLSRGVHRLNVRIDGGAWLVPLGARAEADEFGSVVGVIVIQ